VTSRRVRYGLYVAIINIAAILVGVAAAHPQTFLHTSTASASNTCTHYTAPYFTGNPSTQPQNCYAFIWDYCCYNHNTTGFALRDSNIATFATGGGQNWSLWYENNLGQVFSPGSGSSTYGTIGTSGGQSRKAFCYLDFSGFRDYYCTTLYTT